jgi:exodeoxyribonuclease VII large subunit
MAQQGFLQLSQLNEQIKDALMNQFPQAVWLVAEIFSLNVNKAGHCYIELVEKADKSQKIVAKSRAVIWAYQYNIIKSFFEQSTQSSFSEGIKVLVKVIPQFHELYGYTIIITDIDPTYTLGDVALQRQQIIEDLKTAGVFELNKENYLCDLPKKIAVISSATAAGYGDFVNQLENNPNSYSIHLELFDALMQGNECSKSIRQALDEVFEREDDFDAVVIIRGGGSKSDLSCFDDYDLAFYVCQFPLPIITGIGHERDQSILDLIAHTALKTPTAVAEFLLSKYMRIDSLLATYTEQIERLVNSKLINQENKLSNFNNRFFKLVYKRLGSEKMELSAIEQKLRHQITKINVQQSLFLNSKKSELEKIVNRKIKHHFETLAIGENSIKKHTDNILKKEKQKLDSLEKQLNLLNPTHLLKSGYSLTTVNGKIIKDLDQIKIGDSIKTNMFEGELISVIDAIKKEKA